MSVFKQKLNIKFLLSAFVAVAFATMVLGAGIVFAQSPTINYQGKLTDSAGVTVADGLYDMEFKLYTVATSGTEVWTETLTGANQVQVTNGLFSVMLGSTSALTSVDFTQDLYLGVNIEGDGEMSPRKILGTVPAAFEANNSQTVGGVASTSLVRNDQAGAISATEAGTLFTITQSGAGDILNIFDGASEVFTVLDGGNVGIGSSTPSRTLSVGGDFGLSGALYDSNDSAGLNGYVLQTTAAGTQWVATSSLGINGHDSVTLAGEDYLSLSGQEITAIAINPDNLAAVDFGDFTCNGTSCFLDSSYISDITGESLFDLADMPSVSTGELLYASAANTLAALGAGSNGSVLSMSGGVPVWSATSSLNINTDDLIEGSNQFFTNTLARGAVSETITGLTYTSGTGVFSLDGGYSIPLTASTSEWDTAFGWGDHSLGGYLTDLTGSAIGSLSDVTITAPTNGQLLSYSGGAWVNVATSSLGFATPADLSDYLPLTGGALSGNLSFSGTDANIALGSNWLSGDGADEGVFVDSDGNVGVGTSTPGSQLAVAGDTYVTGTLSFDANNPDSGVLFPGDNYLANSSWKTMPDKSGILLPLYVYPSSVYTNTDYNNVIDLKNQYKDVPLYVILNPGNGAGGVTDGNYTAAIQRLKGAGAIVLGYIATQYTASSTVEMQGEVDDWLTYYPDIDGIFMDEMDNTNDDATRSYYKTLTRYIHGKGLYPSIGNPGAGVAGNFFASSTADVIVTYENSSYPTEAILKGDFDNGYSDYHYKQRASLAYNSSEFYTASTSLLKKYNGLIYVTDDTLPNPWDTVSPYLEEMFEFLSIENQRFFTDIEIDGKLAVGTLNPLKSLTVQMGSTTQLTSSYGDGILLSTDNGSGSRIFLEHLLADSNEKSSALVNEYGLTYFGILDDSGSSWVDQFAFAIDHSNSNIGIGTSTPSSKLTVAGNTYIGGALQTTGTVQFDSLTDGILVADSSGNITASSSNFINPDMLEAGGQVDEYCLTYESGDTWQWQDCSAGAYNLGDLGNVNTAGQTSGSLLSYNGSAWVPVATSTLSINTDDLIEGSNQFFTNTLARGAVSETITGITYTSGTGVFSLDGGYSIPLTASTSEWDTAFGWGDHSLGGYLTDLTGSAIGSLSDVTIGAPADGQLLSYSGGAWVNVATSSLGLSSQTLTLGTDNQIPFTNAAGDDLEYSSSFVYNGTGIGIGDTNPGAEIVLRSNSPVIEMYDTTNLPSSGSLEARIMFYGSGDTEAGYVGRSSDTYMRLASAADSDGIALRTNNANRLIIDNSGNVGIGTTSPASKLDVWGDFRVGTSSAPLLFADSASDKVGIGTNNPSARLHVEGAVLVKGNLQASQFLDDNDTNYYLNLSAAGISGVFNGSVGIGTTTPTSKLTVDGDVFITGALYDNASSTGLNGYVLQSTGSGFAWVATSTLGLNGGGGTVTSVDVSVPTGWTITNNPITTSGTLAFDYDTGYGAVLTASTTEWDTAFGWGDHSLAGYLSDTLTNGYVLRGGAGNTAEATSSLFIADSGNIGIGTTSPTGALEIYGFGGDDLVVTTTGAETANLLIQSANNIASEISFREDYNDQFGANLTYDANNNRFNIQRVSGGVPTSVITFTRDSDLVGIFDSTPDASLEVNGTFMVSSAADNDGDRLIVDGSGNVGIGTNAPATTLQIGDGTATGSQWFRNFGSTTDIYIGQSAFPKFGFAPGAASVIMQDIARNFPLVVGNANAQPLIFGTQDAERMRISPSGNVSISTTSNITNLAVDGNSFISGYLNIGADSYDTTGEYLLKIGDGTNTNDTWFRNYGDVSDIYIGQSDINLFGLASSTTAYIMNDATRTSDLVVGNGANRALIFGTNGAERMRVSAGGNVTIGTTTTNGLLTVAGGISGNTLYLGGTDTLSYTTPQSTDVPTKINVPIYDPGAFGQVMAMGIGSGAPSTARVLSLFDNRSGNHQPTIGVFSPDENNLVGFSWDGSNTTSYLKTTGGNVGIRSNTTDIATFLSSGNVGIGTSTPGYRLTVDGDAFITGALRDSTASAGTNGMVLQTTSTGTQWVATTSLGFASASSSHDAVSLTGENYLSLSGQQINANAVDLSGSNVTGTLAAGRFPALTGDVTTTAGSLNTAIADDVIDYTDILYTHTLASNPAFGANETYFGTTGLIFEGSTANTFETLLTASNPTADRTLTLPNVTGTLISTGDSGTVTSAMLADNTINFADIAYTNTLAGNPALLVDECYFTTTTGGGGFICEGSTADSNEQLYLFPDVNGADTTQTIALTDSAMTGTFDGQEGTYYLDRANHTGTQTASTISDFSTTARSLLSSSATGLTYTSGTGVFSLDGGYSIPLTASTTEWDTAFGWGDHSLGGYLTDLTGSAIGSLSDVTIAGPADGQLLSYSGGAWVNVATSSLGFATPADLSDYLPLTGGALSGNLSFSGTDANIALGSNWLSGDGADEGVFVDSDGNVGVGTNNPERLLHVRGADFARFDRVGAFGPAVLLAREDAGTIQSSWLFGQPNVGDVDSDNFAIIDYGTATSGSSGVSRLVIDKATGNIGIGTSTPLAKLHVSDGTILLDNNQNLQWLNTVGAATPIMRLNAANNVVINTPSGNDIDLQIGGSTVFTVDGSENVGIGTTSPASKLDVWGDFRVGTGTTPTLFTDVSTNNVLIGSLTNPSNHKLLVNGTIGALGLYVNAGDESFPTHSFSADTDTGMFNPSGSALAFTVGGSERLRIDNNGNVGIGTTTPTADLFVYSDTAQDALKVRSNGGDTWTISQFGSLESSIGVGFLFDTNISSAFALGSYDDLYLSAGASGGTGDIILSPNNGNVGIGTTSPASKLDVWGDFRVGTSSTPALFVNSATGGVGINTTSVPSGTELKIVGMSGGGADFQLINGSQTQAWQFSNDTSGGFTFYDGTNDKNPFYIEANTPTDTFYINSSGNIGIGTNNPNEKLNITGTGITYGLIGTDGADASDEAGIMLVSKDGDRYSLGTSTTRGWEMYSRSHSDPTKPNNLSFTYWDGSTWNEFVEFNNSGNVGIGTTTPTSILTIQEDQNDATEMLLVNTNSGNSAETRLTFDNGVGGSGNVGRTSGTYTPYGVIGSTDMYMYNFGSVALMADGAGGAIKFGTGAGGTERMIIDDSGNVGIGTSTPSSILNLDRGAGENVIRFSESGADRAFVGVADGSGEILPGTINNDFAIRSGFNILFGAGGYNNSMIIDTGGNVGIGTTSPLAKLHIDDGGDFATAISGDTIALFQNADVASTHSDITILAGNTGASELNFGDTDDEDAGRIQYEHSNDSFNFRTGAGGTSLTLDSSGNVGIGTSTPAEKLEILSGHILLSNNYAIRSRRADGAVTNVFRVNADDDIEFGSTGLDRILFSVDSVSDAVVIDQTGNVGIGTTSPLAKLHVSDGTILLDNNQNLQWLNAAGSAVNIMRLNAANDIYINAPSGSDLRLQTGGNSVLTIDGDENVGIGTTTPTSKLTIENNSLTGAVTAGLTGRYGFTNSTADAVYYGNNTYITNVPTATSTLVGGVLRIEDSTTLGNVIRGFEVQANRGTNTQGENTALAGFARTFGVRGFSSGDAGGLFEPAGGFFESGGTTQGNAVRAFSSSITSASLVSLFQASSTFSGTGMLMNFGNTTGSFTGDFIDLQDGGTSKFIVDNTGSLSIGNGGLCVDTDGSCAPTAGQVDAVSYGTGNSDLAEMYFSAQDLEPGEIVYATGGISIGRATASTEEKIIGVVSTKPGLTLGNDDTSLNFGETGYPVALTGRVPIKLSTENGPIAVGDKIALSSIPGVGKKAGPGDVVVGSALEDFSGVYAYSAGYINQFGDDIKLPDLENININEDARVNDGCTFGAGGAVGEDGAPECIKTAGGVNTTALDEATEQAEDALDEINSLADVPAQSMNTGEGSVSVGTVLMFVKLGRYDDALTANIMRELLSTSTDLVLGADEDSGETLWDRIKGLAQGFVDGVLTITGIKTEIVETEQLCLEDVCVTADDLRALLNGNGSGSGPAPSTPAPEPDEPVDSNPPEEDDEEVATEEDSATTTESASSTETNSGEDTGSEGGTETSEDTTDQVTEPPAEEIEEESEPEPEPEPVVEEEPEAQEDPEPEPEVIE